MPKQYSVHLINTETNKKIKEIDLSKEGTYIIGRSPNVEIVVQHSSLSRKHAKLEISSKSATLQDLGSVNGTYVNKKQLKENQQVILKHETDIYLGESDDKLLFIEKNIESEEESSEEEEPVEKVKKSKKSKKDKKKKSKKNKKEKVEIEEEEDEEEEESENEKPKKKSRSRSRSRSQEKKQQQQKETEEKKNLSCNKQFGKEKADLNSKFGNKKAAISSKRSLLWGNKEKASIPKEKQIWNNMNIDGDNKLKFMKLLGVKNVDEYKEEPKKDTFIIKSAANVKKDKNEEINDNLEKQFYKGMSRKYMGSKGLGN